MRQYLIILLLLLPVWAGAQMVEPVKWSGEEVPAASSEAVDSVRLTATTALRMKTSLHCRKSRIPSAMVCG